MKHGFKLGESEYDVALSRARNGYVLHRGPDRYPFNLVQSEAGDWVLRAGGEYHHVTVAVDGDDVFVHLDGSTYQLTYEHPLQRLAELSEGGAEDSVRATMPGSLVSLSVKAGQSVSKGDALLVMESMKMETSISATRDATVAEIHVAVGETFDKDAVLISFTPEDKK